MKAFESTILIPDLLLNFLELIMPSLQTRQSLARGIAKCCKEGMQVPVLDVILLESSRLVLQLLPKNGVAHRWRSTACATTARSADRSAALGFQVSGGSSCLEWVRLCLAFQGVGSSLGSAVRLGSSFSGRFSNSGS